MERYYCIYEVEVMVLSFAVNKSLKFKVTLELKVQWVIIEMKNILVSLN